MARLAAALVLAAVLSACRSGLGVEHVLMFPVRNGAPQMPVSVRDLSGAIVGVEIAPAAMEDIDWGFQALADANKVAIGWVSSACDKGATVTLETTQRGTLVTIEPQSVRGECPLGLTGRTVIVTFSRRVDVSNFELDAVTGATP